jgi:hypothetical protein
MRFMDSINLSLIFLKLQYYKNNVFLKILKLHPSLGLFLSCCFQIPLTEDHFFCTRCYQTHKYRWSAYLSLWEWSLHINDLCTSFFSQISGYFFHNPSMFVNCVTIFFSHVLGHSIILWSSHHILLHSRNITSRISLYPGKPSTVFMQFGWGRFLHPHLVNLCFVSKFSFFFVKQVHISNLLCILLYFFLTSRKKCYRRFNPNGGDGQFCGYPGVWGERGNKCNQKLN